ncbi:MAG: hypothetical protein ACXWPM_08260 [Bdellovibrionota bacterium]
MTILGTPLQIEAILPFVTGFAIALSVGAAFRIIRGMQMNLFLINSDSPMAEEALIPITAELKKVSLVRSMLKGLWREDVEISLMDQKNRACTFNIGFHIWHRFHLTVLTTSDGCFIGRKPLMAGKRHYLRNGLIVKVGRRDFKVLVSPNRGANELNREFTNAA